MLIHGNITSDIKPPASVMNGATHSETNMMMEAFGSQEMVVVYGEICLRCMSLCSERMDIHKYPPFFYFFIELN